MKRIIMMLFFVSNSMFSQNEACSASTEESLEDSNSITKCSIKDLKKGGEGTKQILVTVSANKTRFMTKRKKNSNSSLVSKFNLKKNLISLKNNLSKAELSKVKRFSNVEKIPTFNKCKAKKGNERLSCFNIEMIKHINTHFNYPSDAVRDNIEGEVWVRFVIGQDGNVSNIRTVNVGSKKNKILDDEALRVVSNLPNFVPGKSKGKPVAVKYGFPITFSLEE